VTRWVLGRLGQALLTWLLAVTLLFFLMRLTPGDPLARLSEDRPMPPGAEALLRARYGLDQPLLTQFGRFLGAAIRGDLGRSIEHAGRPVAKLVRERLADTLVLGGTVLLLNFTLGIGLGAWQATVRGSIADRWTGALSLAAYATPSFWLGLVLAWGIGTELHWLPVAGTHEPWLTADAAWGTRTLDYLRHLVLPALTLTLVTIGATARYQRAAMIDALALPSIRAARARGLPESRICWRHAWPNALGPVLALAGLWLPLLVAGSFFVESVFAWPGLGSLAASAIGSRDYPVIMGVALLVAAVVVLGNLLADVGQRLLDPRIGT